MISLATIISDSLTFLVLAISAAVLKFGHVQPYQRGFYCYDSSIRYPYKVSMGSLGSHIQSHSKQDQSVARCLLVN